MVRSNDDRNAGESLNMLTGLGVLTVDFEEDAYSHATADYWRT